MTNSNHTLIAALLDRSGSMRSSKAATEDGWRELINEQRQEPGRCEVTLAQFDTRYEVLYPATDIGAVPEFVVAPRGGTALLDATGRFITEVGQVLAAACLTKGGPHDQYQPHPDRRTAGSVGIHVVIQSGHRGWLARTHQRA
ncbi:MAG: hypothetical protein NTY24_04625, partial [Mycobacterium sp.]|nr:hypothetical protein [Mycobacterium sp.]